MKLIAFVLGLLLLQDEPPWAPFNNFEGRRHVAPATSIDIGHYRLDLKLLDAQKAIEGRATITYTPKADITEFTLDAADMELRKVADGEGKPVLFAIEKDVLTIKAAGTKGAPATVAIDYLAKPKTGMTFVETAPGKVSMVWTQGQTDENHHWFPCHDHPQDFATTEIAIDVRKDWDVISNGTLVGVTEQGEWRRWQWKMEQPFATYLVSVIAGAFDKIEETADIEGRKIPLQYFVPKGTRLPEEIRGAFGRTAEMMAFIAKRTGVAYPWSKYSQTVVMDFNWGGMENVTATTFYDHTVPPRRAWADKDSDAVIVHELAHQWFGDLVTCRDWAHIWLNEGFASYWEAMWFESVAGREGLIAELENGMGWLLNEMHGYTRPAVCEHYASKDDLFDAHTYPRGGWVLHMLRAQLGDASWWKGIRLFLDRHRHQPVTTEDFRKVMEEASGKDLAKFFDQWLYKVGIPEFRVSTSWDGESKTFTLSVKQKQKIEKLSFRDLQTERPVFEVEVDVEFELEDKTRHTRTIQIKEESQDFEFKLDSAPMIVDFDRDSKILKTVITDAGESELAYQLLHDDQPWHRWWAAKRLEGADGQIEVLKKAALTDLSPRVRRYAVESLAPIRSQAAKAALLEVEALHHGELAGVSTWVATLNAPPKNAREYHAKVAVQAAVMKALMMYAGEKEIEAVLMKNVERSTPAVRVAALTSLGKVSGAFDKLVALEAKYGADELVCRGLLSGLLQTADPRGVDILVRYTGDDRHPYIRNHAADVLGALAAKLSKDGKPYAAAKQRLIELLDDLRLETRAAAIQALGELGDHTTQAALEKRLAVEGSKDLAKQIRDALKAIKRR